MSGLVELGAAELADRIDWPEQWEGLPPARALPPPNATSWASPLQPKRDGDARPTDLGLTAKST